MAQETIPGAKAIAQRIHNAETSMLTSIMEQFGVSKNDAYKAFTTLKRAKAIKLDPVMGVYNLIHGAFWEKDVILRAIAAAN